MNYYIDFIPTENFLKKIDEKLLKAVDNENIVFNLYIRQLPAMNIKKFVYCELEDCKIWISELKRRNLKINIMFDTFCFGNKEFTSRGKEILNILDTVLDLGIDFITITNNFFFNYIKRRHKNCKIIMSEYSEITNVQKISRYLDDINADAVKIDVVLSKDLEIMEYIKNNFDIKTIHIDTNKVYYNNDIYKDSLNNGISHYIQEEKWEEINTAIEEYKEKQKKFGNERICFSKEDFIALKEKGYENFWHYCNVDENIDEDVYVDNIIDNMF